MHMKYIMNIIIYLRSTITEMRIVRLPCGTAVQGPFLWDNHAEYGMGGRYVLKVKVKSHACAVSLGNCGTIELLRGTAGQWTNLRDSPPKCGTLGNYASVKS